MVAAEAMDAEHWRDDQRRLREALRQRRGSAQASNPRARPLASVIVVAWNAADVLGRCLDCLFAQDYANREIVVVDDGSDDDTVAVAEGALTRGSLTLVRGDGNRGCPAARNLGLRHAGGEIIAFVDADGFADPRWLTEIVAAFGDDPTIGGVASTVFYDDNPMVVNGAGGTVNRQGWAADLAMNQSYEATQLATEALYPMGCGMAIRRAALEQIGPFDDRILNYYDDVDYGTRLWRAGYRVVVAADAWVDHAAAGGDSARKRLLCERHRMRVVLKNAPARSLARWAAFELRSLRAAPHPVRMQKLRAMAWNVGNVTSLIANRRRLRRAPRAPETLLAQSWGDGFPAGVPPRLSPAPERAGAVVEIGDAVQEGQLLHGWFPVERVGPRSYRWAAPHSAVLVSLDHAAARLRLDYAHVPSDIGGVELAIRPVGSPEPLASAWTARLSWQYIARSIENHPIDLPPGDYEVVFRVAEGWLELPRRTRTLAFALASMSFAERFELVPGGLEMAAPEVERQLVSGWFEAEQAPGWSYRWGSGHAAAVVRLADASDGVRLRYRMAPGPSGDVGVSLTPLGQRQAVASWAIAWRPGEWRDESFATKLDPGDYLVSFDVPRTWSNPEGEEPDLPPENRALGLALAELKFE
jgi:GT2 family glycosyltransferase